MIEKLKDILLKDIISTSLIIYCTGWVLTLLFHIIESFFKKLLPVKKGLEDKYEINIIFVDDGSTDNVFEIIRQLCRENKAIKAIQLSRNFGSHLAITAGIEYALDSDAVIVISADLQEPPELIIE